MWSGFALPVCFTARRPHPKYPHVAACLLICSRDAIEADLGVLKLSNTIVRHASGAGAGKGLLLDASSLSFSGTVWATP